MHGITRFVLRHRLVVAIFWIAVAVAGAMTAGTTTKRLTTSFAMPGSAFSTDATIAAIYHSGAQDPIVPVVTLPAGTTVASPGVDAQLRQAFAAAAQVAPATRVVDYATTGDRAFLTRDGRTTFALVSTPSTNPSAATR